MNPKQKQRRKESRIRKEEKKRQRFFQNNNPILRGAERVINGLEGTNEERLGQLEMIRQSELYKARYPGFKGEDIALIVNAELGNY